MRWSVCSLGMLALATACGGHPRTSPSDAAVRDAQTETDASAAAVSDGQVAADGGSATPSDAGPPDAAERLDAAPKALRIQLFSRTAGYRHSESIDAGRATLQAWAANEPALVTATEDPAELIAKLPDTDVVVFLLTTGDVLDDDQQTVFERFIRDGGGFVGIHSAADTEYDWPFYGELVGAWFADHPAIQPARIHVADALQPTAAGLPDPWQRSDEWYNFRENPRPNVDVVLTLDETSYSGGTMGADHPIAWSHRVGKGRAFYTGLAHGADAWQEPLLRAHIENALRWAGGRAD